MFLEPCANSGIIMVLTRYWVGNDRSEALRALMEVATNEFRWAQTLAIAAWAVHVHLGGVGSISTRTAQQLPAIHKTPPTGAFCVGVEISVC